MCLTAFHRVSQAKDRIAVGGSIHEKGANPRANVRSGHVQDTATNEVTDLLQHLIRNECVNDGTDDSGNESRSVDLLRSISASTGLDVETYEATPRTWRTWSRASRALTRTRRRCLLMGHTDVVPVNPDGWQRDPFGGELVDDEATAHVWGRGAVDMLNLTASMAVATKHSGQSGFRPEGTLIYLAVADEEALGTLRRRSISSSTSATPSPPTTCITESGGIPDPEPGRAQAARHRGREGHRAGARYA